MSDITTTNSQFDYSDIGKTASYIAKQQQAATKKSGTQTLDQEDFLKLLTTQLSQQDPTSPVDNTQMVNTMSQLSVVQNLNTITSGMDNVVSAISSSSALSASSLVGRSVLTDSPRAFFDGENAMTAKIDAGSGTSNLVIQVTSSDGQVVGSYTADAGTGAMDFSWDGTDSEGKKLGAGLYTITATGTQNGKSVVLPVSTYATVGSVTLGSTPADTKLSLVGYGDVSLSEVSEIAL